jgi:2-polyprenyl-3-methyl-5-hydroxy-6-metoxy-1,4-benzoquinol methylase
MDNIKALLLKRIDTLANFYGEKGFAEDDATRFLKAKSDKEYARVYIDGLKDTNYIKLKKIVRVVDFIESYSQGLTRDAKILEVGCGSGRYTSVLGYTGNDITGIDFNEELLKGARERINELGFNNVQLQYADAFQYLKHNRGKFDIILALDVIEHMRDPQKFCNLAHDSLSDNGVLGIIVPNGYSLAELGSHTFSDLINEKVFKREFPEGWIHIQRFSLRSIKKIVKNADFNNISVKNTFCLTPLFIFGFRGRLALYNIKIADSFPSFLAGGWLLFCEKA